MEKENMAKETSRKYSSVVMVIGILISALGVMNIASMNVLATDIPWNNGHTVSGTEWYENCIITMQGGNLLIQDGGTLVFNDSVIFKIVCDNPGEYGIIIESNGTFIVNSSSANTEIISDPTAEENTYPFLNSGTIDFL